MTIEELKSYLLMEFKKPFFFKFLLNNTQKLSDLVEKTINQGVSPENKAIVFESEVEIDQYRIQAKLYVIFNKDLAERAK